MAALEFRVLGPVEVRRAGEIVDIPGRKQRALLGLLLLHANEPVSQEELIGLLWGDEPPLTARASLQNYIHGIRRVLGPEVLERQPGGYVLHVENGGLDLERFERLVAEARAEEPRARAVKLRDALALWRGPPIAELSSEPFVHRDLKRLEEERLTALEDCIDAELELGRDAPLVAELEALVARHPLRERFAAQLMLALYRAGRQADALATYRRVHETYAVELGLEPGVTLRELQRAILVQDPALDDGPRRIGSTLERAAGILPLPPRERAGSLYEYGVALGRTGDLHHAVSTLEAAERLAARVGADDIVTRASLYRSYFELWTAGKSLLAHLRELEEAANLFDERGDDDGLFVALRQQSQMLRMTGRADAALAVAERCVTIAARNAIVGQRLHAVIAVVSALIAGSTPIAEAIARCERELAEREPDATPVILTYSLAVLYGQAGRIDEARALAADAVETARTEGSVSLHGMALRAAGTIAFSAADFHEAANRLRRVYAMAETFHDHVVLPTVAAELACALARTGNAEASRLALLARALTVPDVFSTEVQWRRALALVAAREGHHDDARRLSDEAVARAESSDWLTFIGETLEEAALVRELGGDRAGADDARERALAVYELKGNVVGALRVRGATAPGT